MSEHPPSQVDVWYLKQILFGSPGSKNSLKIITQNFNGPCSFIAICNILILRGQIEILPPDRTTVSYEFLSQLVGEYLLTNCPDMDISAALSIMPTTTKGLDLNPQFTSVTAFSPVSDAGELDLFAQAGIQLVHGWVVDPESPEAKVMSQIHDYDTAVTLIADADHITQGNILRREGDPGPSSSRHATDYSDEDRLKIGQAIVAQQFLDATKSQLTYHGLFQLASTLQPGSLVALFRNAHLSVVYKSPGPIALHPNPDAEIPPETTRPKQTNHTDDAALYALVTDDVFLHETTIVWERLEDVDGGCSTFVDSDFFPAVPVGGDVAGQTAEGTLAQFESDVDRALARQLQAEEDEHAREVYERRRQVLERRRLEEEEEQERRRSKNRIKGKKIKNCDIM